MSPLQECILKIFKSVAAICDSEGIPYYAIGGTCLGAVRHQGFIPWDDDLDIAVPIEDFPHLIEALRKNLPDHLAIYHCDEVIPYHYIYLKVYDRNTTFIQNSLRPFKEAYAGVFIDIMPISGVPENARKKKQFIKRLKALSVLNMVRRFPFLSQRSRSGKAASLLLKLPVSFFRFNAFSDRYMRILSEHPFRESKQVGFVWSPNRIHQLTFPKAWVVPAENKTFEDTVMPCPKEAELYLRLHYGDYMKLPPIEERKEAHPAFVDLEHSFKDYQQGERAFDDEQKEGI